MALTLRERKKKFLLTGTTGLGLCALIVVLVNVLGNWFFVRLDLTTQKAYSLSASSRKLVRDLSDPLVIKAYFTPDLPPPYNIYERYTRDLLAEYKSASRGRVRYEFALQSPPGEFEKGAGEAGLLPIQFNQLGSDQVQIRRGYMGLVLYHRDKIETLAIVKNIQQLEYDLTSRIAKMAARTKKTIAVISGHGETQWQGHSSKLAMDLADFYDLKDTPLSPSTTMAVQADALLVVGPKEKFDEKSIWAIDQAIMRGMPAAFLIDIKNFMPGRFLVTAQDAGLGDLLKHYGVLLGDRLLYDFQCESIGVTQNLGGLSFTTSLPYPYIPLVNRIMNTHPIGRGLEAVSLPFTTSIDPVQGLPPGVRFTPLLYTSAKSFFAKAQPSASVAPNDIPRPQADEPHGPYSVGAVVEGTFTSFFQGKPLPVPSHALIGTSPKTQIVVLGTARVLDPIFPSLTGAEGLVSNVLSFLSKDDTLAGIRTKGEIIRPLKPLTSARRQVVKYGTVLVAALLSVVLGLWRWRRRQIWRVTIASVYSPKAVSS